MQKNYCDKCEKEITTAKCQARLQMPLDKKSYGYIYSLPTIELCPACSIEFEKVIQDSGFFPELFRKP